MANILPIKGTTTDINNTPIVDGQLLFETNSTEGQNHIYIDVENNRIPIGIYDWGQIENKPFNSIGTGLIVSNGVLNLSSPITVDWSDITDKPFNTIGDGLYVSSNELKAKIENVVLGWIGSASSNTLRWQQTVYVNEGANYVVEINGSKYMQYSQTLNTNANTVYTFTTDTENITANSAIGVYTSVFGIRPTDITVTISGSTATCTVTFPPYDYANTDMLCRIYIR